MLMNYEMLEIAANVDRNRRIHVARMKMPRRSITAKVPHDLTSIVVSGAIIPDE